MTEGQLLTLLHAGDPLAYTECVAMGALLGGALIRHDARGWALSARQRIAVIAIVFVGGLVGAALPAFISGGLMQHHAERYLIGPKTILGGLLFGFLAVALYKKMLGLTAETSDAFARGTCLMMAIGRVGCHFAHCCLGVASDARWAHDFGDGVPRVPIQLIEAVVLFILLGVLQWLHVRRHLHDRRLFVFFAVYGAARFVLEFWREPVADSPAGIGFYQWIALLVAAIGVWQVLKRTRVPAVVRFEYGGPTDEAASREILGESVARHHQRALASVPPPTAPRWIVQLGPDLLFDAAGLALVEAALRAYGGPAARLGFQLVADDVVLRDYYGLDPSARSDGIALPITAVRTDATASEATDAHNTVHGAGETETLTIALPSAREAVPLPPGLAPATEVGIPQALLMRDHGPFAFLFANQIALGSDLRRRVSRSPRAWLRAMVRRLGVRDRHQRFARAYRSIHPTAEVHPTAVVEGAVIGARARIGAFCVVRYSIVAEDARLHDGAKVELSVVGAGTWLMHDLVLYRSVAERGVFLIHGPYQFSHFQRDSGGFATILMDYRPDGKPIQVRTPSGLRPYRGPFLGSVIGEGAKTLGGTLLAPGRIVPPDTWLAPDPDSIHCLETDDLPVRRSSPPGGWRRKAGSG